MLVVKNVAISEEIHLKRGSFFLRPTENLVLSIECEVYDSEAIELNWDARIMCFTWKFDSLSFVVARLWVKEGGWATRFDQKQRFQANRGKILHTVCLQVEFWVLNFQLKDLDHKLRYMRLPKWYLNVVGYLCFSFSCQDWFQW